MKRVVFFVGSLTLADYLPTGPVELLVQRCPGAGDQYARHLQVLP